MNSEIYGKPTNGNWGVVFQRADLIPRHPTQLYEAFLYLLIFGVNNHLYTNWSKKAQRIALRSQFDLNFYCQIFSRIF